MRALPAAALALVLLAPSAQAHDEAAQRRAVAVSGQGEVSVRPDRARLSIAVEAFNAEVKPAETQVNQVVRAYLAELRALGTRDEHVSTAALALHPEYVWDEKTRANRLTGYRARRDIEVTVTDLDKLGDYLLRATRAGVNQVQPPQLLSSREKELARQALVRATEDARAKAQALAETLGVRLGPIRMLNASEQRSGPPYPMQKMRVMAAAAPEAFDSGNQEMGVAVGEIRFQATVEADFDLLGP